jgi:hypothetical protein
MQEVLITRKRKHEALQAISDLEKRGFHIIYPLTEKTANMTSLGSYNYRRGKYESVGGSVASTWIAKMRRDAK